MPELFLATLGVILLILFLQKLEHAETKLLVATLKWTLVGVLILAAFYLTLVGRLFHVAAIAVLLVILLKRDAHQWVKNRSTPLSLPHPLTEKEAAKLLKVDLNASPQEIKDAFAKMETKDSTKRDLLLQARDLLLERAKRKKT